MTDWGGPNKPSGPRDDKAQHPASSEGFDDYLRGFAEEQSRFAPRATPSGGGGGGGSGCLPLVLFAVVVFCAVLGFLWLFDPGSEDPSPENSDIENSE
ncbi:hypothetical protein [Roseovarius sp. PS-C2]|uniref:hypothetical protein n=1 Tax=Roseovarius sp. PS-C2 TaxID=2820814 RepID=UPI001C0CFE5C|nr:hypothetical protein [Roseovarius sp. PS-C2]MBU3262200.1 hypothetical protein [Roseovarius sp. PS-C2]